MRVNPEFGGLITVNADRALYFMSQMVLEALWLAGPILIATLIVGLIVSVFQVATQIQEITLSYVPKILCAALLLVLLGPWMITRLTEFARTLYQWIPSLGG